MNARRSRTFWPDALTVAGVGEGHTHNVAPRYKRIFLLLMVLLVSMTLAVAAIWWRILVSGEYRDEQVKVIQEQIRQGQCELLDTFPEGLPALERARVKYQCGPGIPVGMLTPEERAQLPAPPAPAAATPVPVPPTGSAAVPNVERPGPAPVPPRTGPGPESSPTNPGSSPTVPPLGPITDPLCDATGVCV